MLIKTRKKGQTVESSSGLVGIITGNGKGKTTSAFGLALRSAGWGKKVLIIQFLKKGQFGEIKAVEKIKSVTVRQFGGRELINLGRPSAKDRQRAQKAFQAAQKAVAAGRYDLVILDEINLAVESGLINKNWVIKLIKSKPKNST